VLDGKGQNEALYLERIIDLTRRGLCPADLTVDKWMGSWQQDVTRLVEGSSYRSAA